ncbi:MAG: AAA family ATPase [Candidatus Omnitrophota bacterium]
MYEQFYGLKENPFSVTSDPGYLYMSKHHKEAYSHILYGIKQRKGFIEITGEVGAGKTTLCRALLRDISPNIKTAFILNPSLSELQLLQSIVEDLGLKVKTKNKFEMLKTLNNFLIEELTRKNNVVLIIDEAQNLHGKVLEQVRLLSNLETEKEKLIQIMLVGQPELNEKLACDDLKQLRQRITVRYHIPPLDGDEIKDYIYHRLRIAGSSGNIVFTDSAIEIIYAYSSGIPRLINVVCDKALLHGYVVEGFQINDEMVNRSIDEIEGRVTVT